MLIENPLVLGTVYLDPRYQRTLGTKKSIAVTFLADLYARIVRIEAGNDELIAVETRNECQSDEEDLSYEELNAYLSI